MELKLIRNAIQTPDGTIIESRSQHDYVAYTDANGREYMVDGGLAYLRRSANGDEIDMSLYNDQPHEVQRDVLTWGTYGINGDQPLQYKSIADMDTGHLEAVVEMGGVCLVRKSCMLKELELRRMMFEMTIDGYEKAKKYLIDTERYEGFLNNAVSVDGYSLVAFANSLVPESE